MASDNTIQLNSANKGGGVYSYTGENASLVVSRNSIGDHTLTRTAPSGGGIHCAGSGSPEFSQNVIQGNTAANGGGIYCRTTQETFTPFILAIVIEDNTATSAGAGGGIWCGHDVTPTISNCVVRGNSANVGGGIYLQFESASVSKCKITCNSAPIYNSAGGFGGGIAMSGSESPAWTAAGTLRDCLIAGNTAESNGGGIYLFKGNPVVTRCIIADNSSDNWGGGVGGKNGGSGTFVNCKVLRTSAAASGGGFYSYGTDGLAFINCLIAGNSAGTEYGGGIQVESQNEPFTILNSTVVDNSATRGGGLNQQGGTSTISNSIFWGNTATTQGQQMYFSYATTTVQWSNVEEFSGDGIDQSGGTVTADDFVIGDDGDDAPDFIDPDGPDDDETTWADYNYRVLADSPVIDKGNNTDVPLSDVGDIDGDGNTTEELPLDLDAIPVVLRRIDDPATADAGAPADDSPYTDFGAYESPVDTSECPEATIQSATPTSGTVDARQPNDVSATTPRYGIGNPTSNGGGPEYITITLTESVGGAGKPVCWSLCESKSYPESVNSVTGVTALGSGQYRLTLARAITAGAVTTLRYEPTGSFVEYVAHPANVNADSASAPADILDLIDGLNEVYTFPWGAYSCDIDHSGECNPADILTEIDLLNGAGVWDASNTHHFPKTRIASTG